MIVTCEECSTSFQLDEARIPATGAQVRCSRCKHAFFLASPTVSQTEAVHAIAEEAVQETNVATPTVASDLDAALPESEPELEEEDWQFSEEVRVEGDDELTDELTGDLTDELGPDLAEESDFGENADFGTGFDESVLSVDVTDDDLEAADLDVLETEREAIEAPDDSSGLELDMGTESEPESTLGSEPEPIGLSADDDSFGSVDDFSELMQDEEPAKPLDLAAELESELQQEAEEQARAGEYAESGPTDDLGDPESWDLVGNDDFSVQGPLAPNAGRGTAELLADEGVDAGEFFSDSGFDEASYDDDDRSATFLTGPMAQIGRVVGWAVSASMIGAIVFFAYQAELGRWAQSPQSVTVGPLSAETRSSGWVETSRSGPVLRFQGEVRNSDAQAIWPGVVQLAWLDAAGDRVASAPVPAGTPLSAEILREAPLEILLSNVKAATQRFSDTPLAPGEVRPFEALILAEQLPAQARRVLLEVGKSAPPREAAPANSATRAVGEERMGEYAEAETGVEPSQLRVESDSSP